MKKLFQNSKQEPRIFYCKHIAPGVCRYNDETLLIGEECLKQMDSSFAGKPIYIDHQKVNLEKIQQEADGYVAESFYLPEDGSHWAKMIVVSDAAHEAVGKGWSVSNAYYPDSFVAGGEWHNIPYDREIIDGHYTHLAIVENPRYEEAEIMTPEEFKQYKESKREQLKELSNCKEDKGEKKMAWKLFTKKEVTNSDDLSNAMVELSDGSAVSIKEMVNALEEEKKDKKNACANEDLLEEKVKVNGEDMKVGDLVEHYEKKSKKNAEDEEEKKPRKNEDKEDKEDKEERKSKKNADKDKRELVRKIMALVGEDLGGSSEQVKTVAKWAEELGYDKSSTGGTDNSKKNEDEEEKNNSKSYREMLNAEYTNSNELGVVVDTVDRKVARGSERYGSK